MKGTIDLGVAENNAMTQKDIVFKNKAPFRSAYPKQINNTFIGNPKHVDIVNVQSVRVLLQLFYGIRKFAGLL